jgi:hypothetical protein
MLMAYVPFVNVPEIAQRVIWVGGDLLLAVWALRQLRLPGYWLFFPPLFQTIVLGHPEVLVLALVATSKPIAGLAVLLKPYSIFPLVAERNWRGIAVAIVGGAATLLVLPWGRFFAEGSMIGANLARQAAHTDSVFGLPLLMGVALVALALLGIRRALWLAVPVLWPYAQLNYKTMTIPMLSPLLAAAWALPLPGATFGGLILEVVLRLIAQRRTLPLWLRVGLEVPATLPVREYGGEPLPAPSPA